MTDFIKGVYYKLPIDFGGLIKKQDLVKIALEDSISQSIFTLMTTSFEEYKFDETCGCGLWGSGFDLLKSDNELKVFVARSLKNSILQHEKRVFLQDVEVTISEQDLGNTHEKRMKKRILVSVRATVLEANRPFIYGFFFFVSPLSY